MRKLLLALALITSPASAQVWNTGPQPVTYDTAGTGEIIGHGVAEGTDTAAQGGTPPALAFEPAPVSTGVNAADWIDTGYIVRSVSSDGNGEAKARFLCNAQFTDNIDPIMMPGTHMSHRHTFIGAFTVASDANYTKLRSASTGSSCPGGPLNRTAYWEPSLLKEMPSGVDATIKPTNLTFYYVINERDHAKMYRLPRGLAFIGGVNPADVNNTSRNSEVPAGWNYGQPPWNGWQGILCVVDGNNVMTVDGTPYSPALERPDHTDPWGGQCKAGLYGPADLAFKVNAPGCWDGHNLTSPNGRDHMRYPISNGSTGEQGVCPQGWWHLPTFEAAANFATTGWDDYKTWYLSSDRFGLTQANWHLRGSTFHFDWMNGWDPDILHTWLKYCIGVDQNGDPGVPGDCNYSTISPTQRLLSDSARPAGYGPEMSNSPITSATVYLGTTARYFPLKAGDGAADGKTLTLHNHP